MSADLKLTRRAALGGLALLSLKGRRALAQGFAGLAESAQGYAQVTPGKHFSFPADHGPHSDYRIEWWYVTANLIDAHGTAYGSQWTLFRQALSSRGLSPGGDNEGWADQQIWMAHAALTRADTHRTSETFARGGVGQAGVEADPFRAWIDAWTMRSASGMNATTIAPLDLIAAGTDFSYALHLEANRPLVLQGDGGYSRKSERDQASYYYSQPFFAVTGRIDFDGGPVEVTGHAWMDREWSSQPLAADQTGWDWFALHFESGEKLMLYRQRTAARSRRHRCPAEGADRDRRSQTAGRMAHRNSVAGARHRLRTAQPESLDGDQLPLLGGPDQLSGNPQRRGLPGIDGVLNRRPGARQDPYRAIHRSGRGRRLSQNNDCLWL
jgi:predicted secreted hydrolase